MATIAEPGTPKHLTVGTTTVCNNSSLLVSVVLTAAAADATLTIYDNASAGSGTVVLGPIMVKANTNSIQFGFNTPMFLQYGITCVLAGTGATADLIYIRSNG